MGGYMSGPVPNGNGTANITVYPSGQVITVPINGLWPGIFGGPANLNCTGNTGAPAPAPTPTATPSPTPYAPLKGGGTGQPNPPAPTPSPTPYVPLKGGGGGTP